MATYIPASETGNYRSYANLVDELDRLEKVDLSNADAATVASYNERIRSLTEAINVAKSKLPPDKK